MHIDARSRDKGGAKGDAAAADVDPDDISNRLGPGFQILTADLRERHGDAIANDHHTVVGGQTIEFVRILEESGGPNRTGYVEFRSQPCLVTFPSKP